MVLQKSKRKKHSSDFSSFARGKTLIHTKKYGTKKGPVRSLRTGLPRTLDKKDPNKEKRVGRILKRILLFFSVIFFMGFAIASMFLIGIVSAYSQNLPNIDEYFAQSSKEGKESIIVDRHGRELYRLRGETLKERVSLKDIPDRIEWAFIAAEDVNFWEHKGVDYMGITRAAICTYKTQNSRECGGGSSITQQLIKKTTGQEDRTFDRKTKEAILAMRVEKDYTKEEILEFYLNIVPEGGVLQGIKSASKYLYGKENLNDLTLAEIAYLTAIPNEPSILSPWGGSTYDPVKSLDRANYVLNRMYEVKKQAGLTDQQIEAARQELPFVKFRSDSVSKDALHFTDYVITELDKLYADKVGKDEPGSNYLRDKGYKVVTTVDYETQKMLEDTIRDQVNSENFQYTVGAQNAAGVIIDPRNGELLAMVGSKDYKQVSTDPRFSPQHNAALSLRSLGSTMKPALYLSAFRVGYQPSTMVPDYKVDLSMPGGEPYFPENYDRRYSSYGKYITMRTALKNSLNVPAVATIHMAGLENYIDTYVKLNGWEGFRDQVQGPAAPLGAANMPLLEQAHAYSTMASGGVYHPKKVILEIYDDKGNLVYDNKEIKGEQVIDPKFIHLINDLNQHYWLFDSNPFLASIKNTMDFAGKTGTGDRDDGLTSDVAFVAYSPTVAIGFWAGNSCGAVECPLDGPAPTSENLYYHLVQPFLEQYIDRVEPARFETPEGVAYGGCSQVTDGKCSGYGEIMALPPYDTIPNNYQSRRNW